MGVSPSIKSSRTSVWLEGLGDWAWPGSRLQAEPMPPSWVPSFPARIALAPAAAPAAGFSARPAAAPSHRRTVLAVVLCALVAACAGATVDARPALERLTGLATSNAAHPALARSAPAATSPTPAADVALVGVNPTGSTIDAVRYSSAALHERGSFLVYLPPGFTFGASRYPVLYLLHGNDQRATAFLELGLAGTLDKLTHEGATPPLIAVMIQGGSGANNWRDEGARGYESYVLEVQQLVDRMFPTLAERGARAIAGDSMGGYGAMNIALGHVDRFAVVESWLGFFNGLEGELSAARSVIARSGLQAFVYGGAADTIADPSENVPFAAALRAAGAHATGAVYAGGHTMQTLAQHLTHMLHFAGGALASAPGLHARTTSTR
jgi:enterochelin esterase-like enzyme